MRDILSEFERPHLSDPDPVRRAQIQMRTPLPRRFYQRAEVADLGDAFAVRLDGKPVRTPGKNVLALPSAAAAGLVAGEFEAQKDVIDPVAMPVLRLANTAIDGVALEARAVMDDIVRYASSDLLCYRADGPEGLVELQALHWDPVLEWARTALGARFWLAEGVIHVEQPPEALIAVGDWLAGREDPFRLAAIHLMMSLTGSALLALAVEAGSLTPDTAWAAAHVDEDWNIARWGEDQKAAARRIARRSDFDAAARLLEAIRLPG